MSKRKPEDQPNATNSQYKVWFGMKNGINESKFGFPQEERRLKSNSIEVFKAMNKRIIIPRIGIFHKAQFRNVKTDEVIYEIDGRGDVTKPIAS